MALKVVTEVLHSIFFNFLFVVNNITEDNGPHRLTGSDTLRRYELIKVGVLLLKEVYHWGQPLNSQMLKPSPLRHSLLVVC